MQPRSGLAEELRAGIFESDPRDSAARIKNTVRASLARIDASARIEVTSYFNHTYSPDFLLRWSGTTQAFRPVYLKFRDDPSYFAEEIAIVSETQPLIVELMGRLDRPQLEATLDEPASDAGRTLVADADGLDELTQGQNHAPILKLFDRAILQGGHGVLNEAVAAQANDDLSQGVIAAQELEPVATRRAADIVTGLLTGPPQARMRRFLQALWVGSGGSESAYPGMVELTGGLDDDALVFLVETSGVAESSDFWRRIGSQLTTDQLARLPLGPGYLANLQELIHSNLDRLWGRAACVAPRVDQLAIGSTEDTPDYYWSVGGGLLSLIAPTFEASVGTTKPQLDSRKSSGPAPSVATFLERARRAGIPVRQMQLSNGYTIVGFSHADESDVAANDQVLDVSTPLGNSVKVVQSEVALTAGGNLAIRFEEMLSSLPQGSTRVPLSELLSTSIAMLTDTDPLTIDPLRGAVVEEAQLGLFDDYAPDSEALQPPE